MTETPPIRRRSPIAEIVNFFMDASPAEAQQALEIAQAIVEKRAAQTPGRRASKAAPVAAPGPPVLPAMAGQTTAASPPGPATAPTPASVPRRRRKGTKGSQTPRKRRPAAAVPAGQPASQPAAGSGSQPRRRRPAVTGPAAPPAAPPATQPPLPDQQLTGEDNPGGEE